MDRRWGGDFRAAPELEASLGALSGSFQDARPAPAASALAAALALLRPAHA
jgi:hypothetical protein